MCRKKGFTLIELVIVIGILAILAAAVILVLNPAQLLAQARDSQRMSDLSIVKSGIALYLATASNATVSSTATCTAANCNVGGPFGGETITSSTAVDGTGWVRIAFSSGATGGPTMSSLPLDPINSGSYFYAYKGDPVLKTFEFDSRLESIKYRTLMETDGGNKPASGTCPSYTDASCYYEIGTAPGLDL